MSEARTARAGSEDAGAPAVTVRYWAGAAAAAGTETDMVEAATVREALEAVVRRHSALAPVVAVSACLLDGVRVEVDQAVRAGETLEILPPFAGG